ncbi:unnamed protein product [Acanthoscelides obtectus]|uniref:Uncharacterized protein n=1 Tax=Acanthoscelides obtectus TaxID=200917 RepID=A0A9P0MAA2_ACAOB|nr:unnamed protein product [Acanthoscelides obtectus]CAK1651848.1 hypothetical protein AOBTE_LOCUS17500 [Acanthoscelides obtectus]
MSVLKYRMTDIYQPSDLVMRVSETSIYYNFSHSKSSFSCVNATCISSKISWQTGTRLTTLSVVWFRIFLSTGQCEIINIQFINDQDVPMK